MQIKPELQLKQKQKLIMTPQLQQAIKMLQISNLELHDVIEQELIENPALEIDEAENDIGDKEIELDFDEVSAETKRNELEREFDDDYFFEEEPFRGRSSEQEDKKRKFLEGAVSREETLHEYLLSQLGLMEISEEQKELASIIIGYIDSMGYLSVPLDEISSSLDISREKLEDALYIVQQLDPPGVGARDIGECLLLQLKLLGSNKLAEKIVKESLNELKLRKIEDIAKKNGVSVREVKEAVRLIEKLEPYPGRQFYTGGIRYIIPDVIIEKSDGDFEIITNTSIIPSLRINRYYERILKKKDADKKLRDFVSEKVQRARNFINSIQQRESTLVRVTRAILEKQHDFFEKGPKYLKPLTLKDIAAEVGLHESTISRITSSKYAQTPHGVFQLKYFFSNPIKSQGPEQYSSRSIKEMIKEIIESEGTKRHLSDQRIADLLAKKGIRIARRTVAKYRKELHILPSNLRR